MVCTNCGALIPTDNLACLECGRRKTPTEVIEEPPAALDPPPPKGIGGWLALLVAYLVFLAPLGAAWTLIQDAYRLFVQRSIKFDSSPATLFTWIAGLPLVAFGLYAGILLWKERPGAVRVAKRFWLSWLVFGTLLAVIVSEAVSVRAWILVDTLFWFCVWYSYLALSKRVANTFG